MIATAVVPGMAGVVLVVVARMMAARKLKPNPLVGIRTARTMRSEAAWYTTHAAAAPWVLVGGVLLVAGAVLAGFVVPRAGDSPRMLAVYQGALLLPLVFVLVGSAVGLRASRSD